MGKLVISKELSDKISNSLRIKQSDIDSGGNKPIIRKVEPPKKDSPQRQRQPSPKHSPIKKRYEYYEYPRATRASVKNVNLCLIDCLIG